MCLRRSLASLARACKLYMYIYFLCGYIWGLALPNTKKLATLLKKKYFDDCIIDSFHDRFKYFNKNMDDRYFISAIIWLILYNSHNNDIMTK